jgi:hypothetical protein
MKRTVRHARTPKAEERLTEAYEVRAFRDEDEVPTAWEPVEPTIAQADTEAFSAIKTLIKGHGEQQVLPDDCQFGDNDLCFVEA